MESHVRTVLQLFESKRRYMVPMFQRQYVWSLERQWKPLWEDIERKTVERLRWHEKIAQADPEDQRELKSKPPAEHFLGAIVLDWQPTYGNEVPTHLIIDGQQRLTTCQILLAALRDNAGRYEANDYVAELGKHAANDGLMADPAVEKYKVWPSQFDQAPFKLIIDAGGLDALAACYPSLKNASPVGSPRLALAYLFFWQKLDEFLSREIVSERLQAQPAAFERVKALFEVFQHELQIVSIELEGQDDPQIIFETLNARGEPLLPSDLLRNYLFWRASRDQEKVEDLYEKYWKPFDSEFWKKEEKQGRLTRPRVDLFFFNFLQVKTGNEVNVARLYHEYKEWSQNHGHYTTIGDELHDIHGYSVHLEELMRASVDTVAGRFGQMLRIFDVKTIFPLVLKLLAEGDLARPELESILTDLESYLLRRQVCGLTSQNYNRVFVNWVSKLGEKGSTISQASVREIMLSEVSDSGVWPDDARFFQSWVNDPLYPRLKSNSRMEYILRQLELRLRTSKQEEVAIKSGLTIEHVLPQDWIQYWPLANGAKGVTQQDRLQTPSPESDRRDVVLHTIGNLTLLTGPLNTAVRNRPFKDKVEQIQYSLLALNNYFRKRVDEGGGWDEEAIEERGRALFEVARTIWPYPA